MPNDNQQQSQGSQMPEINLDAVGQEAQRGTSGKAVHNTGNIPERTVANERVPYDTLKFIPQESAEHYQIAPLALNNGVLEVGMVDPDNLGAIDALNFITRRTGAPFKVFKISDEDFQKVLQMYQGLGGDIDEALSDLRSETDAKQKEEESNGNTSSGDAVTLDLSDSALVQDGKEQGKVTIQEDAPTIKLASTLLRYAIDGKASDVHIEPTEKGVRVRYRVDGVLYTSVVLPPETHRAIVARIKVLSSIRLDEKRKPQDGRFSATLDGRKIDFRVSTFPSYNGEKIVIRILDREQGFIPLEGLGLTERNIQMVRSALQRPYGLILISGPTGSGKSTTLYSMLSELDREKKNVLSLEDPVEYYIDGVSQSQVRPEIGYTFATGLRTTLRQDPDVIMVGEIRDGETAKLAVQAALTGHLVFSTIHTNSAVGAIPRLVDMGVEPYLLPPTIVLSIAQRLVKKLCPGTGKKVPLSKSQRQMIENQFNTLSAEYRPAIPDAIYETEYTAECPNGTRGRLAVFEIMEMHPAVERAILESSVESKIWSVARKRGMLTMKEDAMIKSFNREIPFTEVNLLSGLLLDDERLTDVPKNESKTRVPQDKKEDIE